MVATVDTLVVLVDAEDLKEAFDDWPDYICTAACLNADGGCDLVVFHRDERANIASRLATQFDLKPGNTSFVPPEPGFRARSFTYSDERLLLTLIKADMRLLEEAVDYAVNYNFAVEEGLDPLAMVGRRDLAVTNASTRFQRRSMPEEKVTKKPAIVPQFLRNAVINGQSARFSTVRSHKRTASATG